MSVPKSRRGESPAEYINLAREIYVFTYNRVRILPKSYTFYFSLPLYNAAREAYRLIKTANLIYIHNDADKQNRKELYERAQGYYNSMLDVLDLAYMNVNHEKLPSNVLKEWVKLITDELAQISKIKGIAAVQSTVSGRYVWTTSLTNGIRAAESAAMMWPSAHAGRCRSSSGLTWRNGFTR